jgi:hypothetical protein
MEVCCNKKEERTNEEEIVDHNYCRWSGASTRLSIKACCKGWERLEVFDPNSLRLYRCHPLREAIIQADSWRGRPQVLTRSAEGVEILIQEKEEEEELNCIVKTKSPRKVQGRNLQPDGFQSRRTPGYSQCYERQLDDLTNDCHSFAVQQFGVPTVEWG